MGIREKLKNFFYADTLEEIKNKYKRDRHNFKIDTLTEKELRCLVKYEVLQPTKFNKYEPRNDIEFLLEIRRVTNPSAAQILKKKIILKNITGYLMINT